MPSSDPYSRSYPSYEKQDREKPEYDMVGEVNEELIPLPNVSDEDFTHIYNERNKAPSFIDFFGKIGVEEILLLGIIFILLSEEVKDELLLIALIYLLIS